MKKAINILLSAAILIILTSCSPEADTIPASQTNTGYVDTSPGTKNLEVKAVYPSDESTSVSRSASIVVVFSKPVNTATVSANTDVILSGVTLNPPVFTGGNTIATFTHAALANNTTYTVTIGTGMTAADTGTMTAYVPPTAPAGHHFTTIDSDSEAIDAIPVVLSATRYPTGTVSKDTDFVEVTFSEEMNPATVAFTVGGSLGGASADILTNPPDGVTTDDNRTFRLDLDNSTIDYGETITITLAAGITSSAAVPLLYNADVTWNFAVETDPDIAAGIDSIGSVWITDVSDTQAQINWTTNREIAGSTVDFGTDSGLGTPSLPEGSASIVHSIIINLPSDATRYYFQITSGTATSSIGYFMTKGDGTSGYNQPLSTSIGDNSNLNALRNTDAGGVYNGSSFVTWENGSDIRATYFDSDAAGTQRWGLNGSVLDSNARTNSRAFIDSRGSLIATMEDGANIYVKKVYNNGVLMTFPGYDWGTGAAGTGSTIINGSNPHLSIAWAKPTVINADANTVSVRRVPNTVVVPGAGNWFYDFSTDFTLTTLANNDAVLDRTGVTRGLSLVTNAGTTFRHAVNQSAANIIAGDTFLIGDGVTDFGSFTAEDHNMHLGTNYTNGTIYAYTPHGFSIAAVPWFGAGDIVFNGTNGGIISGTGITTRIPTEIDSGTANADRLNHLIDGSTNFVAASVIAGCFAMNTTNNNYSQITAVTTTDLTLLSDIFPNGNENYIVFSTGIELTYGTASGTSAFELVDGSNIFDAVPVGSYVLNTTDSTMAVVVGGSTGHNLSLSADIFPLGTESYQIWTGSQLTFGTANADRPGHLIDGTVPDFNLIGWSGIVARRHAVNPGNNLYTTVTGVTTVDLALGADIFPGGTELYELYNLSVDTPLESGTSDATPVAGKLTDYTAGTDYNPIAAGSFVMNTDETTLTSISGKDVDALAVNNDIFASGNAYSVYTASNNQSSTTDGVGVNQLINSIGFFTFIGWLDTATCYAINTTVIPNQIAKITGIALSTLTLDNHIFTAAGQGYTLVKFVSVTSGTADKTIASELVHTANDFSAVAGGSYVVNTSLNPDQVTTVTALRSHSVSLSADIFTAASAYLVVTNSGSLRTGNANANRASHLIDGSAAFTFVPFLTVGDFVRNISTNRYSAIQAGGITDTDLTLGADIFPLGTEGYQVIELTSQIGGSGTADGYSFSRLVDSTTWFSGISIPVAPNYIYVLNTSTGKATTVSSVVDINTLALADDIIASGNNYQIWEGVELASGGAKAVKLNHLIDGSALWTTAPVVALGDLVVNLGSGEYDSVIGPITSTDLTFGSDIFPSGNEGYRIYQDYCVTGSHFDFVAGLPYLGDAVNQFYRLQVDFSINTSAGNTIQYYNDKGITGAADTPPVNPLYDNDIALDFTVGPVTTTNDYVFNINTGDLARVSGVPAYARAIGLTANIFTVSGHGYTILRTTPYVVPGSILDSGIADSTVVNQLHLTGANFTGLAVEKGDLVYNVTDQTYATVLEVYADYLLINENIFAAGEGYIIFAANDRITETGINSNSGFTLIDLSANFLNPLNPVRIGDVVQNNSTGLQTTVTAVAATTLTLQSNLTFAGPGLRYVVLQPRILVAFERVTGPATEIYGQFLRLHDGSNCGITVNIYTGAAVIGKFIQTAPDNAGNVFVFYEVGTNIRAKRFNAVGTELNGYLSTDPGFLIAAGTLIKILPDGAGGVYILYEDGTNVYLVRKNSAFTDIWAAVPVSADGIDSALALDSSNRPMVAYAGLSSGNVFISKYNPVNGTTLPAGTYYSAQPINTLTVGTYGTFYQNDDDHVSNISIVSDNSTGAIVSWIDTRFMAQVGFTIHALAVDGTGTPVASWDADSGAATDYNGVKIGIIDSDLAGDLSFKTVNYDTVNPRSLRVIWQDYRAGISDLYYDNFSY